MNVDVAMDRLRAAIDKRGTGAYVITVSDDARPHAVYLDLVWEDGRLVAEGIGATTAANATARPNISLLFPVKADADYTLFVDGPAVVESREGARRLVVTPVRAVFHRPGPPSDPASSCSSDCMPILQAPAPIVRLR
ncbi:MAG TPA: pyridoxamine 5'-phosphate oxidase family protein [Candidatus Limnocylindrales bacterium]|nr:pyridoxamine 5'-phosphate oxidase family protein [Candidatus Limnocylindrales bacterium]